jgi:peptidoglycan/LPS O-acetylase OafA/YrhL
MGNIESQTGKMDTGHNLFYVLDGLRLLASIFVVTRHVPFFGNNDLFPNSYLAVDLFFVLSGFVIVNAYETKLLSGMSFYQFMGIRFIRLYPLYIVGITFGLISCLLRHDFDGQLPLSTSYVLSLLFIPNGKSILYPLNGPAWSISLEILINAAYFYSLKFKLPQKIAYSFVFLSAAPLLAFIVFIAPTKPDKEALNFGFSIGSLPIGILRVTFSFFVGVLICRWFRKFNRFNRFSKKSSIGSWITVFALAAMLGIQSNLSQSWIVALMAVFAVFPLIVTAGVVFQPGALTAHIFRVGGLASYAVYVLHHPIGRITEWVLQRLSNNVVFSFNIATGIFFIAVLLLVAVFVDRYLDNPIRRSLKTIFDATISKHI